VLGPYHLIDQYQRGAIAELLGFVWMPLMLLAGEELLKSANAGRGSDSLAKENGTDGSPASDVKQKWWFHRGLSRMAAAFVLLGVSYGAFIWSHPPTAYQFTLAFGAGMLLLAAMRREWLGLIWIGAGMALGVGLAAAYILPAAMEQNLIHKEYILGSWPYHNTYVFVHEIFNRDQYADFFKRIDWLWGLGF